VKFEAATLISCTKWSRVS